MRVRVELVKDEFFAFNMKSHYQLFRYNTFELNFRVCEANISALVSLVNLRIGVGFARHE